MAQFHLRRHFPGSPVLSDGHALYTPGLSERRNGASLFYNSDDLGNLWSAEDGTGQAEAGAWLFTGFGAPLYTGTGAGNASPLKYGSANGCQTDYDTGLVLMGHRYYDVRTGRFISQDPAGAGGNWYSYAGNNLINKTDPSGLTPMDGPGSSPDHTCHNWLSQCSCYWRKSLEGWCKSAVYGAVGGLLTGTSAQ